MLQRICGELVICVVPVGPLSANCTVVCHKPSGEAIVCDVGGHCERVLRALRAVGATSPPHTAFFTHGHYDHVLGAADIKATDAKLALHRADVGLYNDARKKSRADDVDDDGGGAPAGDATAVALPAIDRFVAEGDEIRVGPVVGRVLETPGHTRGSCCLYFESCDLLVAGDLLFRESYGRTDLPGGSDAQIAKSLKRTIGSLPGGVFVVTGHGETTTIDYEREHNMARIAGWL
jgi:glyoxylase-like metal-dependent hydrolase (beta-lactamase superfamily II)